MPGIKVNDTTFAAICTLSTWFQTQSPSETLDLVVQQEMERLGLEYDDGTEEVAITSDDAATAFDTALNLRFVKATKARVNDKQLENPTWASILYATIAQLKEKGIEGDRLVQELGIPSKIDSYEKDGYRYYPELGISFQGQPTANAWKEIDRLAKKWRIPVKVDFIWRQNPKAQYPGKKGVLRSGNP